MKNYRVVIHIKNHNLCIILILSFLLGINISHIYNEESKTNVYLKIAATRGGGVGPPLKPGHARGPSLHSPQGGGGGQAIMLDSRST